MERNRFLNLISAFIAAIMLALSLVGCAETAIQEISEAIEDEKKSEQSTGAQDSTDKKGNNNKTEDQSSLLGDLEVNKDNNKDDNNGNNTNGDTTESVVVEPHTVLYAASANGSIEGQTEQSVAHGESATTVIAIPDENYVFTKWSDGYMSAERTDTAVDADISVYPIFVHEDTIFMITYTLMRADEEIDSYVKTAKVGETITFTAPAPTLAYQFDSWDDGITDATRSDVLLEDVEIVGEYLPLSLGVPSLSIITEDRQGIGEPDIAGGEDKNVKPVKDCTVTLYNAEDGQNFENLSARIRGRGKSSWQSTDHKKRGFKLKFDEQIAMLGSEYKSKNWNFISNHGDKSFLRNMIAYDLSAAFDGLDYTTTHKFIDVYIDGEYYGFFMMCDDLDVGKGRIEYDKTVYADPSQTTFFIERGANHAGATEPCPNCVRIDKSGNDLYRTYCIKYPDDEDLGEYRDTHLAYIKDYLYQCMYTMGNDNTSENKWEEICALIDVDSFIDHYIIQELFLNKDAFWCSIFFYKAPNGKLYAGPVWDFDQGAGSVSDYYGAGVDDVRPDADFDYVNGEVYKTAGKPWVADVNSWYRRLLRRPEFVELLKARMVELGPTILEILETADPTNPDGYYATYGASMERNFERWDIMGKRIWPSSPATGRITTVTGQMDYMREWLVERYFVLCDYYGVGDQVAYLQVSPSSYGLTNEEKLVDGAKFISSIVILDERRKEAEPEEDENND